MNRPDFYAELCGQVCPECPLRELPPETWQNVYPDVTNGFEFSDTLVKSVLDAENTPEVTDRSTIDYQVAALDAVHARLLPLAPCDADDLPFQDLNGELVAAFDMFEQIPAAEFDDTAKGVLACIQRNVASNCIEKRTT